MADEIITTSLVDESDTDGVETIEEWNPANITELENKTNGKFLGWVNQCFWKIKNSINKNNEDLINSIAFEYRDADGKLVFEDCTQNLFVEEFDCEDNYSFSAPYGYGSKTTTIPGTGILYIPKSIKKNYSCIRLEFESELVFTSTNKGGQTCYVRLAIMDDSGNTLSSWGEEPSGYVKDKIYKLSGGGNLYFLTDDYLEKNLKVVSKVYADPGTSGVYGELRSFNVKLKQPSKFFWN